MCLVLSKAPKIQREVRDCFYPKPFIFSGSLGEPEKYKDVQRSRGKNDKAYLKKFVLLCVKTTMQKLREMAGN